MMAPRPHVLFCRRRFRFAVHAVSRPRRGLTFRQHGDSGALQVFTLSSRTHAYRTCHTSSQLHQGRQSEKLDRGGRCIGRVERLHCCSGSVLSGEWVLPFRARNRGRGIFRLRISPASSSPTLAPLVIWSPEAQVRCDCELMKRAGPELEELRPPGHQQSRDRRIIGCR